MDWAQARTRGIASGSCSPGARSRTVDAVGWQQSVVHRPQVRESLVARRLVAQQLTKPLQAELAAAEHARPWHHSHGMQLVELGVVTGLVEATGKGVVHLPSDEQNSQRTLRPAVSGSRVRARAYRTICSACSSLAAGVPGSRSSRAGHARTRVTPAWRRRVGRPRGRRSASRSRRPQAQRLSVRFPKERCQCRGAGSEH